MQESCLPSHGVPVPACEVRFPCFAAPLSPFLQLHVYLALCYYMLDDWQSCQGHLEAYKEVHADSVLVGDKYGPLWLLGSPQSVVSL